MAKTALITGVGGQDGRYLSQLLLERGYRVVGLTRGLSSGRRVEAAATRFETRTGDLLDEVFLVRLLGEIRPNEVYNLAAISSVPSCRSQPAAAFGTNGLAVLKLLEAILRVDREIRFFQASSSQMYAGRQGPVGESTPLAPIDPYGTSKVFGHCCVSAYREAHGLFACSGILFNHESPLRGENFVSRKISRQVARIRLGLDDRLALGDLSGTRDWGYAGDCVDAMWRILQQDRPGDYVVGTGVAHTVEEFVETAFSRVGLDWRKHVQVQPRLFRRLEGGPLTANIRKAREVLGWRPTKNFVDLVHLMVDADLAGLG